MVRILEYSTYIGFTFIVGGFTTYFYKLGVGFFLSIFLLGASDGPPTNLSLVTYFLILAILPILYGLSVFGFFTLMKYFLEFVRIQLRIYIGVIISTVAALYTLLCFLDLFFPKLPIPFSYFNTVPNFVSYCKGTLYLRMPFL